MFGRTAKVLLALAAAAILLVLVGAAVYHFGCLGSDWDDRVIGPMRDQEGWMNNHSLWLAGLAALALVGLGIVVLVATVLTWGRGSSAAPAPAPAPVSAPAPSPSPVLAPPSTQGGTEGLDRLKELSDMHDRGALTDEEFTAAKRRLLGL
jgi:hypothetical protein